MADAAINAHLMSADGIGFVNAASSTDGWVSEAVDLITEYTEHSGQMVSDTWRDQLPTFFATYRDGQIFSLNGTAPHRKSMFYPKWWLDLVGYWNIGGNPKGIYFASGPNAASGLFTASNVFAAAGVVILGFASGRYSSIKNRRQQYIPL